MSDARKRLKDFIVELAQNPQLEEQIHQTHTEKGRAGLKDFLKNQGLSEKHAALLAEAQNPLDDSEHDPAKARQHVINEMNTAGSVWTASLTQDGSVWSSSTTTDSVWSAAASE